MKKLTCVLALTLAIHAQAADTDTVHFTIDATKDVKPISRFIYGVNQKLEGNAAKMPFARIGGNRITAYNWTNNASNAGSDWQFQNDNIMGGGDVPGAGLAPTIENALAHDAGIVITVPIVSYVAADKKGGGDVRKSGADYLTTRFRKSEPKKGAPFTLTPDPNSPIVYQDEFVNWVKSKYLSKGEDKPVFFAMDNEPDLWASTHKEVHPENPSYAEVVKRTTEYAAAIKAVLPKTKIFGPVNYGWQGFVRLQNAPDAQNRDFQEVYLKEMAAAEKTAGKRLLDVLDVHWYPEAQGGGKRISGPETAPQVVAARLQAPRSLWDPEYTETSWITKDALRGPIKLFPRLQEKIEKNYPGTKIAMTEYNYGGGDHISGAIAEADVLGIFGREGLFAANEWPLNGKEGYIVAGLRMYRDYDTKGATFGETSIHAATDNIPDTSIYASLEKSSTPHMVLVALNKTDHPITANIHLDHAAAYRSAKTYQLTSASQDPKPADPIAIKTPSQFDCALPPFSVTTLVLSTQPE